MIAKPGDQGRGRYGLRRGGRLGALVLIGALCAAANPARAVAGPRDAHPGDH